MLVVTLTSDVSRTIATEARWSSDGLETGGILLGHDTRTELIVTVAGDAGPGARRRRHRFDRDLAHAQQLADDAYDRDGSVWIGEWHTHPRGPATPSGLDVRTYLSHVANETLGFERFLSIIVLPCPDHAWDHVNLVAWVVHDEVVELAEVRADVTDG